MYELYRSKCTNGVVLQGKCKPFETENVTLEPCKGLNSCSSSDRICVRSFCHLRCSGQDCLTVDSISIVKDMKCHSFTNRCEAYGDKYCSGAKGTCEPKVAEGASCKENNSLDLGECGGDRVQMCYENKCMPVCTSDKDCNSGKACQMFFFPSDLGVCVDAQKEFPWKTLVSGIFGVFFIITCIVAFVLWKKKRKRIRGKKTEEQSHSFITTQPTTKSPHPAFNQYNTTVYPIEKPSS